MKILELIEELQHVLNERGNVEVVQGNKCYHDAIVRSVKVEKVNLGTPIPFECVESLKPYYYPVEWERIEQLYKNGGTLYRYDKGELNEVVALY